MSGIEGVRLLKQRQPRLLILMLTVYKDDDRIFGAMCAGACGYLLKKTPPARLLESLQEVVNGGAPMSPEVARRVIDLFRRFRPLDQASCGLTAQEIRLLKLLGEGHHYKTAAAELGLSVHTVGYHMRGIYEKLQVHSKSEAVSQGAARRADPVDLSAFFPNVNTRADQRGRIRITEPDADVAAAKKPPISCVG
jgi:DNA-binding NarL/FixJ family response regulator